MRLSVLLAVLFSSAGAIAMPAFTEPVHDNTAGLHAQDALSNNFEAHLFLGRDTRGAAGRGLISYKPLVTLPDHSITRSGELPHHAPRQHSPSLTIGLFRIDAAWCKGGSHLASEEDKGAVAQIGHATLIRTNRPDVSWNSPARLSLALSDALVDDEAIGWDTFKLSNGLAPDGANWIDNPEAKSGWILSASKGMTDVMRFHGRRSIAATGSPALEVEYSVTESVYDYTGLRYDPELSGEGDNIDKTPSGWLINLFDFNTSGKFLWVTSDPVTSDQLLFDQPTEFPMLVGMSRAFYRSTSPNEHQIYGMLIVPFDNFTPNGFGLDGLNGEQTTHAVKLVGINHSQCP